TITLEGERAGPIPETVVAGPEPVAGHTTEHGPVFINWTDLRHEALNPDAGRNVAYHEFAHKLDAENGPIDGTPAVGRDLVSRWRSVCDGEYRALRRGRGSPMLRGYAATEPGEFFAVTTEVFFTRPVDLALDRPELYAVFRDYYGQDPAAEWTHAG
ncbi:MAG: zinc-dependent peptidase, partial [Nitriliruptorales bacterium]|nr:zinc-dependent peptidase [Nitriliruptorales bacterium]